MPFIKDIAREKVKLVKYMNKSKLAKSITSDILMPILDQLENDSNDILEEAAQLIVDRIKANIIESVPSGRTYKIVEYDPSKPRGQRSQVIGEHIASAPGEPPALLSGTLVESIGYEMFSDGSFVVGLMPDYGEFSEFGSEFESSGYSPYGGGAIIIGEDPHQSPVGTYGRALEGGFTNAKAGKVKQRPWFRDIMEELKKPMRDAIREAVQKSLNKITRRYTVRRAFVFKIYYT